MRYYAKKVRERSSVFAAILSVCKEIERVILLTCVCFIAFPATLLFGLIIGVGDLCDLYTSFRKARK